MNLLKQLIHRVHKHPIDPVGLAVVGGLGYLGFQVALNGSKPGTLGYKVLKGAPSASASATTTKGVNQPTSAAPASSSCAMDTCRAFNAPLGSGAPAGWSSNDPTWRLFSQVATGGKDNK